MNVIARLLLRTRGYASFFFIVAVATVFYINVNRWVAVVPGWDCRAEAMVGSSAVQPSSGPAKLCSSLDGLPAYPLPCCPLQLQRQPAAVAGAYTGVHQLDHP